MYFPKRIPEPKAMGEVESKVFEKMSFDNFKRWIIPLVDDALTYVNKKDLKILDIGCGPGLLVREFSERSNKFNVVGIDISEHALKFARINCRGRKNVRFIKTSVNKLPFKKNSFDLVISKDSLHHFPNAKKAIMEMLRVLKEDGVLYIQDLRRDIPYYLLKQAIPRENVMQKLQYYSARASYTRNELKEILKQLKTKNHIFTRVISVFERKRYPKLGIDLKRLKESFQSRYAAIITK